MANSLQQYEDVAEKSVARILKDTDADSVAIIVTKRGDTIAALDIKSPVGALGMMKATQSVQDEIAEVASKKIAELKEPCNCPECRAKRAESTTH